MNYKINIKKKMQFVFGYVNYLTYICIMKVSVDIELLEKAVHYLTLYSLLHEDIKNEDFKSMLGDLTAISSRPECPECGGQHTEPSNKGEYWCWVCEKNFKTEE